MFSDFRTHCYQREERNLGNFLTTSQDKWLASAYEVSNVYNIYLQILDKILHVLYCSFSSLMGHCIALYSLCSFTPLLSGRSISCQSSVVSWS